MARPLNEAKEDLTGSLTHHRGEEDEHAAMVPAWLRKRDGLFHEKLEAYLFTEKPIPRVEALA